MGRVNQKGRNTGSMGRFIALPAILTESPAWASLTCQDRCVYLVIAAAYNGKNNGWLGMGARTAAERANVNKDTATKSFRNLQDRGLIEMSAADQYIPRPGEGGLRRATEWRLTLYKCDRTGERASKAFLKWKPGAKTEACPLISDKASPETGQSPPDNVVSVPSFRTERAA